MESSPQSACQVRLDYVVAAESSGVARVSGPAVSTTSPPKTMIAVKTRNTISSRLKTTMSRATESGARNANTRPMAAAQPEPVPRIWVGYTSGVYVYTRPQAPRLKKLTTKSKARHKAERHQQSETRRSGRQAIEDAVYEQSQCKDELASEPV
jgi:hypothetical protein